MADCTRVIEILIDGDRAVEVLTEGPQGPAGAPGEPIMAVIGDDTDIGAGGWWVTRDYHAAATMNYLRVEVLAGAVEGVTLSLRRNGVLVRDGIALSDASPTILTDLGLALSRGDAVSVHREAGGSFGPGPWLVMIQIDGRA